MNGYESSTVLPSRDVWDFTASKQQQQQLTRTITLHRFQSLSLCYCTLACGPNMLTLFSPPPHPPEYYLQHSDWLKLLRWVAPGSPLWRWPGRAEMWNIITVHPPRQQLLCSHLLPETEPTPQSSVMKYSTEQCNEIQHFFVQTGSKQVLLQVCMPPFSEWSQIFITFFVRQQQHFSTWTLFLKILGEKKYVTISVLHDVEGSINKHWYIYI